MIATCRLIDSQAAKRHCSGQAGASSNVCHVTKEMIDDFEISKKGFEMDTVDHMSSRELDLGGVSSVLFSCVFQPYSATAHQTYFGPANAGKYISACFLHESCFCR